jgi:hypothetical protein
MPTERFPARSQPNEDEALADLAGWDLLHVTAERRNGMAVVHLRGEVELATVARLGAVLDHELVSGAIDILLDLSGPGAPPALGDPRVGRRARSGGRVALNSGS